MISGIQGLAYLIICRRRAVDTWPALFVLLPMGAWMYWHLHFVLNYAVSGNSWYQLLSWKEALFAPLFLCGSVVTLIALGLMTPLWAYVRFGEAWMRASSRRLSPEMTLVCTGLLSAACVVAIGFVRPSFSMRYLLPYVGAVSLLIPIVLRDVKQLVPSGPLAIILLLVGSALPPLAKRIAEPLNDHRYGFNFEQPSDWIIRNSTTRKLVFLWDNPTALMGEPDKLAEVGGYFFRRHGRPIEVLIPRYALNADPNPAVLHLARGRPETAIIWAYDRGVPNTSALIYPPRLAEDKEWRCRNFGLGSITVLTCIPAFPRTNFHSSKLDAPLG